MILDLPGRVPTVHPTAWIAPQAVVVGDVVVGEQVSIWYGTVVRADLARITLGPRCNLQDGVVLHTDPGFHLELGEGVSVGHRAVLHGCRIEPGVLVGMGSVVMNGAVIGTGSVIGAGAVVPAGSIIPPRSLVLGTPGKVRRETTAEEVAGIALTTKVYNELRQLHAAC